MKWVTPTVSLTSSPTCSQRITEQEFATNLIAEREEKWFEVSNFKLYNIQ